MSRKENLANTSDSELEHLNMNEKTQEILKLATENILTQIKLYVLLGLLVNQEKMAHQEKTALMASPVIAFIQLALIMILILYQPTLMAMFQAAIHGKMKLHIMSEFITEKKHKILLSLVRTEPPRQLAYALNIN